MDNLLHFSAWDLALISVVAVHATALAYLHHPRWKAFLLTLPVPFSLATLAVGARVDTTNVVALMLLLGYTLLVYQLHARWRVPVVVAIVLGAAGFCLAASFLAPRLPRDDVAFWTAAGLVFVLGLVLFRAMPHRPEPGHRGPLPLYLKLPLIAMVVTGLVLLKRELQGFMTMFPMVGVIASYEGRHCLWTLSRQIPVVMLTSLPLMATVRLLTPHWGLGGALAGGWVVFLAVLVPLTRWQWRRAAATVTDL
jgi:hypothetical protein